MLFTAVMIICLPIVIYLFLNKRGDQYKFSKTGLSLLFFSLLYYISLNHNYRQSLVPGANDGIGISNKIAYWIITDKNWGIQWSIDLFKKFNDYSMGLSAVVLLFVIIMLVVESKSLKKCP